MKRRTILIYALTALLSVVIIAVLATNVISTYRLASEQTEEMGRMRIEIIASDLQENLSEATHSLERIGVSFEQLLSGGADSGAIRSWLSEEKKVEIASAGRTCLNIFCITGAGDVLISDMPVPEDYVVQDRIWYQGLMSAPKGQPYISSVYHDAFTDGMCFTVSKILNDGETILGIDYSMSAIQAYIEKMNSLDYGQAMIVNRDGLIVGYSDPELVGERLSEEYEIYREAFTLANSQSTSDSISVNTSDDDTIFCSHTENDWYLMLLVRNWDLYRDGYRQLIVSSVALALMIVVFATILVVSLKERFRAENALRKKERFLSSLSDRFRAPLHKINELSASEAMSTEAMKPTAESIRLETGQLSNMMDNLFSYSDIVNSEEAAQKTEDGASRDFTVKTQYKFRFLIIAVFLVTMVITILISAMLHLRWARVNMTEEANSYSHQVSSWVLEQQSILGMFVNEIATRPDMVSDYPEMVKWLDSVSKHYPGISATYIANPAFDAIHGHPMIMNNGWIPADDYVEEERDWYIGALAAEDYSITEPYYDARTGQYCLTFSKAVYTDSGEFVGVFAIDFYLNVLSDIINSDFNADGYAFLADKDGQIINHPNPAYHPWNGNFVNLSALPYADVYNGESGSIGSITDYDGKHRECIIVRDDVSNFNIVVVKNFWSIYGDVIRYAALYVVLFSICILGVAMLINKMIHWQKTANENLSRAVETATAADKAKSKFLAQMSHEIRTPINAVLGMNEMILRENSDPVIEGYSENIKNASSTLLSLINDILDFSKIESGKMEILPVKYDTASVVNDLVNIISDRAASKGLSFVLDVDRDVPSSLLGDDVRLKQIIINLLTNAVKYTEEGSVTLTIKSTPLDDDDSVMLHVAVSDTGIGIKDEDMNKLYDSFQRIEESRTRNIEGTGLGIPITHNLLKMMGSSLNVSSVYGSGSVFSFDVKQGVISAQPIGDFTERRQASLKADRSDSYVFAPDADILIVDDNEMNLRVAAGLMKRNGFVPDTAGSGRECIERVSKRHYDIIFMDHMMPEMDGIETLHALTERGLISEDTAVIAMTANAVVEAREEYLQAGFTGYLSKPIIVKKLEEALEKYLPKEKVSHKRNDAGRSGGPSGSAAPAQPEKAKIEEKTETKENENMAAPSQNPGVKGRFPFLDTDAGMTYCANDEDFYLEMIGTYFEDSKLADIEKCYAAEDWANYRILVHALKSTSLSIGAVQLSEGAKALEMAAKEGDTQYIRENHANCMSAYRTLLAGIDAGLHGKAAPQEAAVEDAPARERILVVDDDRMNLKIAERLLKDSYDVSCVQSGEEALGYLKSNHPDMILLDLHMPGMDGFDVLKEIRRDLNLSDIPVIFLTADDDQKAEVKGFEEGAVDFIKKPFVAEIMLKRIQRMLELSRLRHKLEAEVRKQTKTAEERRERMERLSHEAVLCLSKAIDAKDRYTNGHSERVAKYSREIARRAGMSESEQQDIYFMALLHDVGKIGIPDRVINKPGRLTDEEFTLIQKHPVTGFEILKDITEMPGIGHGARWHHERYGGGGYPDGIRGEDIPVNARIIGVADAYDAMTSKRSYRDVLPQDVVKSEIERGIGSQFDPVFAKIMLEMIEEDVNYELHEAGE